jgi:hypothetical protein
MQKTKLHEHIERERETKLQNILRDDPFDSPILARNTWIPRSRTA